MGFVIPGEAVARRVQRRTLRLAHALDDGFRAGDFDAVEGDDPAEEVRARHDLDLRGEAVGAQRGEDQILAEAVDEGACHVVFALEHDAHGLAAVHAEDGAGIARGGAAAPDVLAEAGIRQALEIEHLVDAEVLDDAVARIEGREIVVFIIPEQRPGADLIPRAVAPERHFALARPAEIVKAHLHIVADRLVEAVDIIINALVRGFDAAGQQHLTVEIPRIVAADEALELFDQLAGFALGDEFGRLHRVDEQLQLRQLERAADEMIAHLPPVLLGDDVVAEGLELLEIVIERFALDGDLRALETLDDLRHGEAVGLVRLALEHVREDEQL